MYFEILFSWCSFQDSCLPRMNPIYLTLSFNSICFSPNFMFQVLSRLYLVVKTIISVFVGFTDRPAPLHQASTQVSGPCTSSFRTYRNYLVQRSLYSQRTLLRNIRVSCFPEEVCHLLGTAKDSVWAYRGDKSSSPGFTFFE